MITSTVLNNTKSPAPTLPAMFISNKTNAVVLFFNEFEGQFVDIGNSSRVVGEQEDSFISCFDVKVWRIFKGSVTLKQE